MVVNCADFSLWGAGGGSIKAILNTMSSQYTGRLFKMYIIRAGSAVNVLYSFLSSRQKQRIVLSKDLTALREL